MTNKKDTRKNNKIDIKMRQMKRNKGKEDIDKRMTNMQKERWKDKTQRQTDRQKEVQTNELIWP